MRERILTALSEQGKISCVVDLRWRRNPPEHGDEEGASRFAKALNRQLIKNICRGCRGNVSVGRSRDQRGEGVPRSDATVPNRTSSVLVSIKTPHHGKSIIPAFHCQSECLPSNDRVRDAPSPAGSGGTTSPSSRQTSKLVKRFSGEMAQPYSGIPGNFEPVSKCVSRRSCSQSAHPHALHAGSAKRVRCRS